MKHPETSEWMDFLYGESSPERKREMEIHLADCADCARHVSAWQSGMSALNDWKLPNPRHAAHDWLSVVKWAAAAAVVLCLGFYLGRQTSPAAGELAGLKASVAELAETMQNGRAVDFSNAVSVATTAASAEALRLFSEYARLQDSQRATDQQDVALALGKFDARLRRLRTELETVALNTENGFELTHENFTRLASASPVVENSETSTHQN